MQTETARSPTNVRRLPVNPRRHKVAPEQRKRVATACNSCNIRRIKCSGDKPCLQCSNTARDCTYPVLIEKVAVSRSELDELRRKVEVLERCLQELVPDAQQRQEIIQQAEINLAEPPELSLSQSSPTQSKSQSPQIKVETPENGHRMSPEMAQVAQFSYEPFVQRDYRGGLTGATFLESLKDFMTTIFPLAFNEPCHNGSTPLGPLGTYQTYDSRPIYIPPEVDPLWLPARPKMVAMLAELRYFIQDGSNGELPSGGIYWWGDLNSVAVDPTQPSPNLPPDLDKYRHLAFYHTAFAVYSQATSPAGQPPSPDGVTYFSRARKLLGNPLDIARYTISDVAVLALMGYHMIETNRRDAAYMYVSVAMHISIMHGAHRGWLDERGKRVFWTLYILDRWLSCLMGRPPTLLDEAIRLQLPCDAPSLPPAAGLRAHVELSRISGYIVGNSYKVAAWEHNHTTATLHLDKSKQMLERWLNSLPPCLQMNEEQPSTDPAVCALHMTYNQLLILTLRPIYFVIIKKSFAERYVNRRWSVENSAFLDDIRACSNAARRNLELVRWLVKISPSHKLLQSALHHVFSAEIILMLQEMVCCNLGPEDVDNIRYGIDVFRGEARSGNAYAVECAKILNDMNTLVYRFKAPQSLVQAAAAAAQAAPPACPVAAATPTTPVSSASGGAKPAAPVPSAPQQPQQQRQNSYPQSGMLTPPDTGRAADGAYADAAAPAGAEYVLAANGTHIIPFPISESDAVYQTLASWMEYDDMQLYNSFLI